MDLDEDDDFYAPEDRGQGISEQQNLAGGQQGAVKQDNGDEDLEEGEEEDEGSSDSDSVWPNCNSAWMLY